MSRYRDSDVPSLILEHLYVGSRRHAREKEFLECLGIDSIINVAKECEDEHQGAFHYLRLAIEDSCDADLLQIVEEANAFIDDAQKRGSRVLVHCTHGVSRSSSIAIAYLMKHFGWSLVKAFDYVKDRRPCANPNAGFLRQLQGYETRLLRGSPPNGKTSPTSSEMHDTPLVTMVTVRVNPVDGETDLDDLETRVHGVKSDGLCWGIAKRIRTGEDTPDAVQFFAEVDRRKLNLQSLETILGHVEGVASCCVTSMPS